MKSAFERSEDIGIRRASVVYQKGISTRQVVVLFRVRNVIRSQESDKELVAEELYLWGYKGQLTAGDLMGPNECYGILDHVRATADVPFEQRAIALDQVTAELKGSKGYLAELTRERTKKLIDSHTKYSEQIKSERFTGVEPVLPPDPIAVYVIMPDLSGAFS